MVIQRPVALRGMAMVRKVTAKRELQAGSCSGALEAHEGEGERGHCDHEPGE